MFRDLGFWNMAGVVLAATGQTLFVLLYLTFPWWRNFLGRALFGKALVLAIVLDLVIVGRLFDWPHERLHFVILTWVLVIGIWAQTIAFFRVRLAGRQNVVSGNKGPMS